MNIGIWWFAVTGLLTAAMWLFIAFVIVADITNKQDVYEEYYKEENKVYKDLMLNYSSSIYTLTNTIIPMCVLAANGNYFIATCLLISFICVFNFSKGFCDYDKQRTKE